MKAMVIGYLVVLLALNGITFAAVYINAGGIAALIEGDISRMAGDVKMYKLLQECRGEI